MIYFMYGPLVKWLTHRPLKATFMGSNPIWVTNKKTSDLNKSRFYVKMNMKNKSSYNKKGTLNFRMLSVTNSCLSPNYIVR